MEEKGNTQVLRDKVIKTKAKTHFIWQEANKTLKKKGFSYAFQKTKRKKAIKPIFNWKESYNKPIIDCKTRADSNNLHNGKNLSEL